jgi:energy-coupling factor transport system ATP-binding protein
MISIRQLSFNFAGSTQPLFSELDLDFAYGEFALICGPTGGGKSTLLKSLNGLVPFHSSGTLRGSIQIDGQTTSGKLPHDLAHLVGYVNQQPEGAFVSDLVIEELAFGMEQLGFATDVMHQRIERIAERMKISHLLQRPLDSLSGGQQQRVAIAAALVAGQRVLLLDEPTSALDVAAAGKLLHMLRELATIDGVTVIMIEHRIERVLELVDSITYLDSTGRATKALRTEGFDEILHQMQLVPPMIELGKQLNWNPLPLSIAEAKSLWEQSWLPLATPSQHTQIEGQVALFVRDLEVTYDGTPAVSNLSLSLAKGTITALFGENGSGKSSTLWAILGETVHSGTVTLADGQDPADLKATERLHHLALVPQSASDLLLLPSIAQELADSDDFANAPKGTTEALFIDLVGAIDLKRHPRDLSAGQQLALALAIQLAKGAEILLLDEPTRGLDYQAKHALALQLQQLRANGITILLASHDVEFVAGLADHMVVLEGGRAIAQGSAAQILPTLGEYAPQVWQITQCALTVQELADAI